MTYLSVENPICIGPGKALLLTVRIIRIEQNINSSIDNNYCQKK